MLQQVKPLLEMPTSHIAVPVQVLPTLLLIQLLTNVPWRQQVMTQVLGSLPSIWETQMFLAPGFGLAQALLLWAFGSKPEDERFAVCVSLSVTHYTLKKCMHTL